MALFIFAHLLTFSAVADAGSAGASGVGASGAASAVRPAVNLLKPGRPDTPARDLEQNGLCIGSPCLGAPIAPRRHPADPDRTIGGHQRRRCCAKRFCCRRCFRKPTCGQLKSTDQRVRSLGYFEDIGGVLQVIHLELSGARTGLAAATLSGPRCRPVKCPRSFHLLLLEFWIASVCRFPS